MSCVWIPWAPTHPHLETCTVYTIVASFWCIWKKQWSDTDKYLGNGWIPIAITSNDISCESTFRTKFFDIIFKVWFYFCFYLNLTIVWLLRMYQNKIWPMGSAKTFLSSKILEPPPVSGARTPHPARSAPAKFWVFRRFFGIFVDFSVLGTKFSLNQLN